MRRAGSIFCLALVCALGAGVAPALADGGTATIAENVAIGPVQVGGMTEAQAAQAVISAFLSPVTLRVGSASVTVSPSRFHVVAPVGAAVEQAATAAPGTVVPLRASVDLAKVSAWVAAFAERHARAAVEPRLLLRNMRPVLTASRDGLVVKQFPTRILLRNALRDAMRDPIVVPTRAVKPTIAKPAQVGPVIVIRRGDNRLTLFHGTKSVRTFPVATGQTIYPTPLGRFQIVVKWKNPTWYPPTYDDWAKGLKPVPPGPDNPLGTRWMGLSVPGVGIHGTDEPASIGYSVSHGCIRMQVPDAEWLFDHVNVGTPVFIVPG